MNTTTTTTISRRFALGAAIAGLCLGAAACGTTTADPAGSLNKASSQQQSRISPRAAEHQAELEAQAQRERAERADAERWAQGHKAGSRPGDSSDLRQTCRREGHPTHGLIRCTSHESAVPSASSGPHRHPELIR